MARSIEDPDAFEYRFATRPLGGTAQLDAQRGGKPVKLTVALEAAPDTGRDEITLTARSPFQGAKVANISPAVADELATGFQHRRRRHHRARPIRPPRLASASRRATSSIAVNGTKIGKTSDLDKVTREGARLWRIVVVRGGQQINVTLGG
jgi:hypothetical protein